MKVKKFKDKSTANQALFDELKHIIYAANDSGRTPKLLLSGGSSPKTIYKKLGQEFDKKNMLKIGLVDERFVPTDEDESNEKMIRSCFSYNTEIVGMVLDDKDYNKNLALLKDKYTNFKDDLDIVILGMGQDGHFASMFPSDPNSTEAIKMKEKTVLNTNSPNYPEQRITCNMEMISGAKHIYLLIFGQNKLDLLENLQGELPIKAILDKRPDIQIFYAND